MNLLTNPLATPDQLYQRRSFGALPIELQDAIFFSAQCLTQAAGILLELPQSITAQANVVLARFWLEEQVLAHEFSDASAAALWLVAKVGPRPVVPRDLSNVYSYLLSSSSSFFHPNTSPPRIENPHAYFQTESSYHAFRERILALEERILYALSFDLRVALPHPLAITYLQALEFLHVRKEKISRRVLEYLNTALLSPQMLYLTSQPNALAVAAIYNAAKDIGAKMPECEWWEVLDVDREELGFLVVGMRSVDGWARKMREDVPKMAERMITRADIQKELTKLGVAEISEKRALDAEEEMARQMDEKMAEMEEGN
ncbi:cyclin-L2 [Podospora australis]|uniref:Cyclin-L2 n=1 Tax=Podospora australis TaxID=1536484 RepID=A0AAN6X2I5_9PEZI|nr:cyclin-L2 [Podospora australis]